MAKGTFLPAVDDVEDVDLDFGHTQTETTNADNKADALVSALREDSTAYVNVLRQTSGGNSPMQFVERIPADKFDHGQLLTYLGATYGGGEYRLMVYARGKLRANKLESIASKLTPEKIQHSPTGEAASILATVLDRIENSNRQMLEMLSRQTQAPDRSAMLQEMLLYKQLFDNGNKSSGGIGQIQEAIELVKSLGVSVGGVVEKEEEGFGALLEKMTPLISAAVTAPSQRPHPQPQTQQVKPMFAEMKIKMFIGQLISAAAKNSNPMTYAELIFDMADENLIKQYITNPQALEILAKKDPRIAQYKPWFDDLVEHVKAQLGLPSRFADLYQDGDDVINGGNELQPDE